MMELNSNLLFGDEILQPTIFHILNAYNMRMNVGNNIYYQQIPSVILYIKLCM